MIFPTTAISTNTYSTQKESPSNPPFLVVFIIKPFGPCKVTLTHDVIVETKRTIIGICWFIEVFHRTYHYKIEKSGYKTIEQDIHIYGFKIIRVQMEPRLKYPIQNILLGQNLDF